MSKTVCLALLFAFSLSLLCGQANAATLPFTNDTSVNATTLSGNATLFIKAVLGEAGANDSKVLVDVYNPTSLSNALVSALVQGSTNASTASFVTLSLRCVEAVYVACQPITTDGVYTVVLSYQNTALDPVVTASFNVTVTGQATLSSSSSTGDASSTGLSSSSTGGASATGLSSSSTGGASSTASVSSTAVSSTASVSSTGLSSSSTGGSGNSTSGSTGSTGSTGPSSSGNNNQPSTDSNYTEFNDNGVFLMVSVGVLLTLMIAGVAYYSRDIQ
jgi:hypothetical protein